MFHGLADGPLARRIAFDDLLESRQLASLTPKEAARVIGEAAEKATNREDDITVAVMRVKECA